MTLISRIYRFNRRRPWSHNDFYGGWVVDRVASSKARSVLDIGCGTGNLIGRLRVRVEHVTGIEPDPEAARVAAARFADIPSVVIEQRRFDQRDPARQWDAITLVASLHHLPLTQTLRDLDRCLAPGGCLVVIGCYRESGVVDLAIGLVATVANMVIGVLKHPRPTDHFPLEMTAPTAPPRETLSEIRAVAGEHLRGARIRRRLFWRYSLVYDKPSPTHRRSVSGRETG
ncbi:class I SAM-dependent methyltransferase [Nocardia sp. bgisy134]|uniref:class I SAM-dependent methyltransferase n=1 Tax=Nocardia sp. bgisy134 TaxID=3413789 RepID=UPI003D71FFB0